MTDTTPDTNRYVPSPQVRIGIVVAFTLQFLLLKHLTDAAEDGLSRWLVVAYTVVTAMPVWFAITISDGRRVAAWIVAALVAALLAALGWSTAGQCAPGLEVECSPILLPYVLLLSPALLVAGVMVRSALICGTGWRRWPDYHVLYREAWQVGLALVHAGVVTGAAWILLFICGQLFHLLGIDAVRDLLENGLFATGFTGFALGLGVAVWLSLVRAVESVRQIILGMAHLLMPLVAVIVVAFTLTVFITGPAKLFEAYEASWWMLGIASIVIVLFNGVFQDGQSADVSGGWSRTAFWIRYAAVIALVPVLGLVAYGLGERIHAYGWTVSRVYGVIVAVYLAAYTLGYLAALVARRIKSGVQLTNLLLALGFVVIALALLSPVASPTRIAAMSQLHRIQSGAVELNAADFHYLRYRSGIAGYRAWQALGEHPRIRDNPEWLKRWETPERLSRHCVVHCAEDMSDWVEPLPDVAPPPETLLASDVFRRAASGCKNESCWVVPIPHSDDQSADLWAVLTATQHAPGKRTFLHGELLQPDDDADSWRSVGHFNASTPLSPDELRERLVRDGLVPIPKPWPDLDLGGIRLETYGTEPVPDALRQDREAASPEDDNG